MAAVQGIQVGNTTGTVTVAPSTATRIDPVTYTTAVDAAALGSPLLSAKVGLNQEDERKELSTAAFRVPGSVQQMTLI